MHSLLLTRLVIYSQNHGVEFRDWIPVNNLNIEPDLLVEDLSQISFRCLILARSEGIWEKFWGHQKLKLIPLLEWMSTCMTVNVKKHPTIIIGSKEGRPFFNPRSRGSYDCGWKQQSFLTQTSPSYWVMLLLFISSI